MLLVLVGTGMATSDGAVLLGEASRGCCEDVDELAAGRAGSRLSRSSSSSSFLRERFGAMRARR